MHTINICPRCGSDFMYHQTDVHLIRQITIVDEVGNNEIIDTVICQECDGIECAAEFIKEKAEHRGWENAKHMAKEVFGDDLVAKAFQLLDQS